MELPTNYKKVDDVKTTIPEDYILAIREPAMPGEIGILAINPEKLKERRIEGRSIYINTLDIPKLISKLEEVVS